MSKYTATVNWSLDGQTFIDNKYKRVHQWEFDSGQTIQASASPNIVPVPLSDPAAIDPEEAFVASLSSCHMLWFLSIASKAGFIVKRYHDKATGLLKSNEDGKRSITQVTLFPCVTFLDGDEPSAEEHQNMHELADEKCFIANSVKTRVIIKASMETAK